MPLGLERQHVRSSVRSQSTAFCTEVWDRSYTFGSSRMMNRLMKARREGSSIDDAACQVDKPLG